MHSHPTSSATESVLFHATSRAFQTRYSWIVSAQITIGDISQLHRGFLMRRDAAQRVLAVLKHHPMQDARLTQSLQTELDNLNTVYESYQHILDSAAALTHNTQPMQPLHNTRERRSLMPFLGTGLKWLTGTATERTPWNYTDKYKNITTETFPHLQHKHTPGSDAVFSHFWEMH